MKAVSVSVVVVLLVASACGEDGAPVADPVVCDSEDGIVPLPYEASMLEGCTHSLSSVHVPDPGENALEPLVTMTQIDGSFTFFRNHGLTDLRGLEALEIVGGELAIYTDDSDGQFTSLEGLGNVRELGGLRLQDIEGLQSLDGLAGLEAIFGELRIENNPSLPQTEIDAFLARVDVQGEIVVEGNGP